MDSQEPSFVTVVTTTFILGALGGLAALLRSTATLTRRAILSACLNSSLIAMASAGIWVEYYPDAHLFILMVVSIIIGIGGNTSIGIVSAIFFRKFDVIVKGENNNDKTP